MRKNNFISCSLIFLILFLSGIFSCSNLFDGSKADNGNAAFGNSTKTKTVKFNLNFEGAFPAEIFEQLNSGKISPVQNNFSSRSAMPNSFSIANYQIIATKLTLVEGVWKEPETPVKYESEKFNDLSKPSSLDLPYGKYYIQAVGFLNDKKVLSGFYKGTDIYSEKEIVTVGDSITSPIAIVLSPFLDVNEEDTGSVALTISFDTDCPMEKVVAKWLNNENVEKTQTVNSQSGSATITLISDDEPEAEFVSAGSYKVEFSFYKLSTDDDPIDFYCEERIHVFPGMTTNVWKNFGNCGYIDAGGNFILKKSVVYSRHIYYVSQTDGNDDNAGSAGAPLKNLKIAVNKILANNDGSKYTIALLDDYFVNSEEDVTDGGNDNGKLGIAPIYLCNNSNQELNVYIKSAGTTKFSIDANGFGHCIIVFGQKKAVNLTLENIKITGAGSSNYMKAGAVYVFDDSNLILNSGCEISENSSYNSDVSNTLFAMGGGVCLKRKNGSSNIPTLTINPGAVISGNHAGTLGAGVYIKEGKLFMNGGSIFENTIDGNLDKNCGGGIYLENVVEAVISGDSKIYNNNGGYSGGGIYLKNSTLTISDETSISGNNAQYDSAMNISDNSVFTMNGGIIGGEDEDDFNTVNSGYPIIEIEESSTFNLCGGKIINSNSSSTNIADIRINTGSNVLNIHDGILFGDKDYICLRKSGTDISKITIAETVTTQIPIYCDDFNTEWINQIVADGPGLAASYQIISLKNSGYHINSSGAIEASITSPIGSKSKPTLIGDIVFSDGTAEAYSSSLLLTDIQKENAVGIVFAKSYDLDTGNTNGETMLMVGIRNTGEDGNEQIKFSNNNYTYFDHSSDTDGSKNIQAICFSDNNGYPDNYPAYVWLNSYAQNYVEGEKYSSDWYIPSISELMVLCDNKNVVNNSLYLINSSYKIKTGSMDIYMSSSQVMDDTIASYQQKIYTILMNDGIVSVGDKDNTKYVLAVRKVE